MAKEIGYLDFKDMDSLSSPVLNQKLKDWCFTQNIHNKLIMRTQNYYP